MSNIIGLLAKIAEASRIDLLLGGFWLQNRLLARRSRPADV